MVTSSNSKWYLWFQKPHKTQLERHCATLPLFNDFPGGVRVRGRRKVRGNGCGLWMGCEDWREMVVVWCEGWKCGMCAYTGRRWSATTTPLSLLLPPLKLFLSPLTTLEMLHQICLDYNNGSFLELEKPPLKSLQAEPMERHKPSPQKVGWVALRPTSHPIVLHVHLPFVIFL